MLASLDRAVVRSHGEMTIEVSYRENISSGAGGLVVYARRSCDPLIFEFRGLRILLEDRTQVPNYAQFKSREDWSLSSVILLNFLQVKPCFRPGLGSIKSNLDNPNHNLRGISIRITVSTGLKPAARQQAGAKRILRH
jgi:hypothetical protein